MKFISRSILHFLVVLISVLLKTSVALSNSPAPALVGYWQNWNDFQCPYIQLTQIDTSYNIIAVAFAVPSSGTNWNMTFAPEGMSAADFKGKIDSMHLRGKKVLISVGGANHPIYLTDTLKRNTFVSTMMSIISFYGFDGVDLDVEGTSLTVSGGTIASPVDAKVINMISAIKKIMDHYRNQFGKKMMLTMAPETAFVQGGMSAYSGIWGAYLPVIHALRDSIDIMHVQLYNSGSMYGIDGNIYFQGTVDFILSQTEAVIQGFNTAGGYFAGLRQDQVAVGLPACPSAAGGGYILPDSLKAAINYLRGISPKPARYTKIGAYPNLRGMMDWSINWDAVPNCASRYEYANSFNNIFRPNKFLSLTCFLEAFYDPLSNQMRTDTVKAYLRDTISPYVVVDSTSGLLNSAGTSAMTFTKAVNSRKYFISIRHRNSIETWGSTSGVTFSASLASYNFSSSALQAYGNNLKQIDTSPIRFGVFGGDVNQDGFVDAVDNSIVENASINYVTGYLPADVNGDNLVDASDAIVTDNNSFMFVQRIVP